MKRRTRMATSVVTAVLIPASWSTAGATPPSWGPEPGFVAQATYTGIPAPGAVLEVTCSFMIPTDALGVVYLDSLKKESLKRQEKAGFRPEIEGPDSLLLSASTNIEVIGAAGWGGQIQPGLEYVFTTTIRLKSGKTPSQISFGLLTRYGRQLIRGLAFFTERPPEPIGYVTKVIVDSLGNYWHKHETVADSTLNGFVPFGAKKGVPPDTSFDKTGKVLLILQVLDPSNSKFLPHGIQPGIKHVQRNPYREKANDIF